MDFTMEHVILNRVLYINYMARAADHFLVPGGKAGRASRATARRRSGTGAIRRLAQGRKFRTTNAAWLGSLMFCVYLVVSKTSRNTNHR